jgi:hypothetical protein
VGDPYVIARELCGGQDYFLSYASAMELHRMVNRKRSFLNVSRYSAAPYFARHFVVRSLSESALIYTPPTTLRA